MSFEPVDCVPNYELCCWGQTYERWLSEGLPDGVVTEDWFEGAPYFHLERRRFAPVSTDLIPPFEYEVLEETDRYLVARHSGGIVTRALKEGTVRGTRMCMDQYLSFPVTDRRSFEEIKKRYDPHSSGRYPANWEEWVKEATASDDPLCLFINGGFGLYSQLRSWVGTEGISWMFYDDPTLVEEMIEFNTEFMLTLAEPALNEVRFDFYNFFEDFAGKGGPLISPQIFRKFLLPYYQRIVARFRQAGVNWFWFDSDGDVWALMPLLLEAGINCLWPLEQASGMDPVRLRKEYGNSLALAGGIDKLELAKDKEAIKREVYAKIPPLLESGGYFPFLDHAFSPEISYDNFLYYLELKRELIGQVV